MTVWWRSGKICRFYGTRVISHVWGPGLVTICSRWTVNYSEFLSYGICISYNFDHHRLILRRFMGGQRFSDQNSMLKILDSRICALASQFRQYMKTWSHFMCIPNLEMIGQTVRSLFNFLDRSGSKFKLCQPYLSYY